MEEKVQESRGEEVEDTWTDPCRCSHTRRSIQKMCMFVPPVQRAHSMLLLLLIEGTQGFKGADSLSFTDSAVVSPRSPFLLYKKKKKKYHGEPV